MKSILKNFNKQSKIDKFIICIISILLVLFLLFILVPLVYVFIGSFIDPNYLIAHGLTLNFTHWTIKGYTTVLNDPSITHAFFMSMFYSFAFSFLTVVVSLTMAYPLSIKEFVGRKFINSLLLITMFFGGGLIPTYLLINKIGMYDTIWAILIPGLVGAWNIILARTFIGTLPSELKEASDIDGCSHFLYFLKIAIPLSKPIIAVLFLYSFVGQWNSYFDAMIYLVNPKLQPLQLVLRSILIQNTVPPEMISDHKAMAYMAELSNLIKYSTIIISSAPLLIMFPFFQKYFDGGVMVGSLKG